MKNHIVCLILLFSAVVATAAAPSDPSIEQMMRVMQVERMLDQMLTQLDAGVRTGMEQSLQGKTLTDAQKARVGEFQKKLSGTLKEELSFTKMKDIYLQVYRETFSQDEINSIIAFYSSPAGKAMVEKTPIAMQKAGSLMQARIGPITQKLQGMIEQFEKDLLK